MNAIREITTLIGFARDVLRIDRPVLLPESKNAPLGERDGKTLLKDELKLLLPKVLYLYSATPRATSMNS